MPTKKRRRNRTLKDYFTPIQKPVLVAAAKPSSAENCNNENHPLFQCPRDILYQRLFSLLTVEDLTHLSNTCRLATRYVDTYRGPLPYIIKEELLPPRMLFINFSNNPSRRRGVNDDLQFDVNRLRTVRFLLKTRRHRIVQITFNIGIFLWSEMDGFVSDFERDHQETWIEITVRRQLRSPSKSKTNNNTPFGVKPIRWSLLFENMVDYFGDVSEAAGYNLENDEVQPWMTVPHDDDKAEYWERINHGLGGHDNSQDLYQMRPISVEDNERACTEYFWVCAKRIASSPAHYGMPSLDYIIQRGLPRPLLRFLPPPYNITKTEPEKAPKDIALWMYRNAASTEERRQFFRRTKPKMDAHGQKSWAFQIHEIPWYKKWYPKPITVHPKHILQSVPVELVESSILPFLSESDRSNLSEVGLSTSTLLTPFAGPTFS